MSGAQVPKGLVRQGGRFGWVLCLSAPLPQTLLPPADGKKPSGGGAETTDTDEKGRSKADAEGEARSNARG